MDDTLKFSLGNLTANPSFNFINSILSQDDYSDNAQDYLNDTQSPYAASVFNCNYVSENNLSLHPSPKKLTVMSLNIQSLPAKFQELKHFLFQLENLNTAPDVICLQEIWTISDPSLFNLKGYSPIEFKTRKKTQGGGVAIYFKSSINYRILNEQSVFIEKIYESIYAEVWLSDTDKLIIGSIYRSNSKLSNMSSSDQFNQFIELFSTAVDNFSLKDAELLLLGDFNLDVLQNATNPMAASYIENLFSSGLLQIVTKPTRVTNSSATCIDHILTNKILPVYNTFIVTSKISDHFPIFYVRDSTRHRAPPPTVESRNFSEENLNKFKTNLSNLQWEGVLSADSTQTAFDVFISDLTSLYDIHFPIVKKKFNKKFHYYEKWMSKGLLISRLNKIQLGNLSLKTPSIANLNNYKNYRNLYNKTLRAGKKLYFHSELKANHNNQKNTWNLLNLALNRTRKANSLNSLKIENVDVNDPKIMAEHFNLFFATVAEKIASQIHPAPDPPPPCSSGPPQQ